MTYEEHLASPEWKVLRRLALEAAGHRCVICDGTRGLQVHHRNYIRLGQEQLADLTVLRDDCHAVFHHARRLAEAMVTVPAGEAQPDELGDWPGERK